MIRRILLPLDSNGSECAVRFAESLAIQHNASIVLLGVVDTRGIARSALGAGPGSGYYAREVREHHLDHARRSLDESLTRVSTRLKAAGVPTRTVCEIGSVKDHVLQYSLRADIIVVAREANFRFETADEPGAELEEILRLPTRPTIVVPEEFRPIKTVIVAHDFSLHCARTLFVLLQLGLFPRAKHLIVHADPEGQDAERDWTDGEAYLREHGLDVEFIIRNLEPAESVLEVVQQRGADLVVLGPWRKGTFRRLLQGSVGKELLERAKVPLLIGI